MQSHFVFFVAKTVRAAAFGLETVDRGTVPG
jgi:hypothetical protein